MTRSYYDFIGRRAHHLSGFFILTVVFSAMLSAHAATTVVTNQPPFYADREVSQDATVAGCGGQTRIVNVELSFTATPSNNVQIAFGTDLNKDGRLSFGEVRMTVGWDCGRWFLAPGDLSQEIDFLAIVGKQPIKHFPGRNNTSTGMGTPCERTVQVHGRCYYGGAVNYALFGRGFQLCSRYNSRATLDAAIRKVYLWKWLAYNGALREEASDFVAYGFQKFLPSSGGCASCYVSRSIDVSVGKQWNFKELNPLK